MKMHTLVFKLSVLVCLVQCHAADTTGPSTQPAESDLWRSDEPQCSEYTGDIGGNLPIGMTLRRAQDGKTATGCYFYHKYCKDIRIDAALTGRSIVIREFDAAGKQTGLFVGEFQKTDPRHHYRAPYDQLRSEVMVGTWSNPDGSKKLPFYLILETVGYWPEGAKRYQNAGFDDDTSVNRFAARFRQAVLDGDAEQVAQMIQFPIKVTMDGGRRTIRDAHDFLKHYEKIFTPSYVERLRQSAPYHMFSKAEGVMFGDVGEVWIAPVQTGGKTNAAVIALNNDF